MWGIDFQNVLIHLSSKSCRDTKAPYNRNGRDLRGLPLIRWLSHCDASCDLQSLKADRFVVLRWTFACVAAICGPSALFTIRCERIGGRPNGPNYDALLPAYVNCRGCWRAGAGWRDWLGDNERYQPSRDFSTRPRSELTPPEEVRQRRKRAYDLDTNGTWRTPPCHKDGQITCDFVGAWGIQPCDYVNEMQLWHVSASHRYSSFQSFLMMAEYAVNKWTTGRFELMRSWWQS